MPFVHINSLPFAQAFDARAAIIAIARDFAAATGVPAEHVTVTWQFFPPHHYAAGGQTAEAQPRDTHPVLVDLLAPDFNSQAQVETMLRAVGDSVAEHAPVAPGNVFVNYRSAKPGGVLDGGELVRWR